MTKLSLLLMLLFVLPVVAAPKERIILPGAAIKGIEATPRVTFIVPWQRSSMKDFPLLPSYSALEEIYKPMSSQQLELEIQITGSIAIIEE